MDLYICDFTKNTECSERGSKCAFFGGNCSCTSKEECAMNEKDIKNLSAEDFMSMHRAIPEQGRKSMLAKDWYWVKLMDSIKETGWGDADEKERSS